LSMSQDAVREGADDRRVTVSMSGYFLKKVIESSSLFGVRWLKRPSCCACSSSLQLDDQSCIVTKLDELDLEALQLSKTEFNSMAESCASVLVSLLEYAQKVLACDSCFGRV
jgi:hypothetical protein